MSSFTNSIGYAPTVFEAQLQQYESDIRNLIKTQNEHKLLINDSKIMIDKLNEELESYKKNEIK